MKRGAPQHPKTRQLCKLLGISLAQAVGHLELLWHFTAQYAPQGNIGRFTDEWIEAACDWCGKSGALIGALRESGWADEHPDDAIRLVVHDWHVHADDAVRKRLSRGNEPFLSLTAKVTGKRLPPRRTSSTTQDESGSLPVPLPVPLPLPEPEPVPEPLINPCSTNSVERVSEQLSSDAQVKPVSGLTTQQAAWFAEWYAEYWRHVARKPAEQAFKKHVKTGARFEQVMKATRAQKPEMLAREPEKRPHPASWLNAERWTDEPENVAQPKLRPAQLAVLEAARRMEERNAKR